MLLLFVILYYIVVLGNNLINVYCVSVSHSSQQKLFSHIILKGKVRTLIYNNPKFSSVQMKIDLPRLITVINLSML
jgi:hypothetical protein